ncbi:RNA ligase family protein [Streptomyces mirabilis]|uniref:RNA ligase family protein n=1 Tax=Streptomyces mirabilis TaxID=68239 RepID=UPI0036C30353
MAHEFAEWPKTQRLFRDITVTEKLDGTNAGIHISAVSDMYEAASQYPAESYSLVVDGVRYVVSAQSRKRLISPGKTTDNYGFAGWVYDNADALVRVLGEGLHFGEWGGQGIQRGYGLDHKRFSLFNTARYVDQFPMLENGMELERGWVDVVPMLYQGPNDTDEVKAQLNSLAKYGSVAAPGWPTPEGVCVYHSASRQVLKATLDNHDAGKWEA